MFLALSVLLFGCQTDEAIYQNALDNSKLTVSASLEIDSNSRTTLDGVNIHWNENDALSIFLGNGNNKKFTILEGAGTNTATFIGSGDIIITGGTADPSVIWTNIAYYPYSETLSITKNNTEYEINTVFQEVQQFAGHDNFAQDSYPLIAVAQNHLQTSFSFKHVGSILKLRLKGDKTISKIRLKSDDYMLAGPCTITAAYGAKPNFEIKNGSSVIMMDCGENGVQLNAETETNFTFAVPPMSIKSGKLSFTIYDTEGKCMTYTYTGNYDLAQGASGRLPIQTYIGRDLEAADYPIQMNQVGYNSIEEAVADITDGTIENTITLSSGEYILPDIKNKSICFIPKEGESVKINTSVTAHNDTKYEGSSLSFKNLTIVGTSYTGSDNGYVQAKVEKYEGCTFLNYFMFAGDNVTVTDCKFKTESEQYFWTGSSSDINFTGCDFYGVNRALKVLSVGNAQTEARNVTFTDCHFYADKTEKAVLELDSKSANSPYNVVINNCTKSETFTTWFADKDESTNKYAVTINGIKVWPDNGYEMTSENVYDVWNAKGLLHFSETQQKGVTLNILNDIDFENAEFKAIPAGRDATLTVNGNNHAIKNVKVVSGNDDNTTGQASMFYAYTGSTLTIENLKFENIEVDADINGSGYAAVVVGYAEGKVVLNNVDVNNANVYGQKSCGVLVGYGTGTSTVELKDCDVVESEVEATEDRTGAYAGRIQGSAKITNCSVDDEFKSTAPDGYANKYIGQRYKGCSSLTIDGIEYVDTYCGLQDVINQVAKDGTAILGIQNGVYTHKYTEIVNKNITLQPGIGASKENITLDGQIFFNGSSVCTVKDLTLTNENAGDYPREHVINGSTLTAWGSVEVTVDNCTFNQDAENSGASAVKDWWATGNLTWNLNDCVFNCNGQRPLQLHETATITGCTFNEPYRYALQVNSATERTMTMKDCKIVKKSDNGKPAYFIQLTNGGSEGTTKTANKKFIVDNNTFDVADGIVTEHYVAEKNSWDSSTVTITGGSFVEID